MICQEMYQTLFHRSSIVSHPSLARPVLLSSSEWRIPSTLDERTAYPETLPLPDVKSRICLLVPLEIASYGGDGHWFASCLVNCKQALILWDHSTIAHPSQQS